MCTIAEWSWWLAVAVHLCAVALWSYNIWRVWQSRERYDRLYDDIMTRLRTDLGVTWDDPADSR